MVTNKHINKIIAAITAMAVILCFLAVIFADKLSEAMGGTAVHLKYENKLFDTDEIISINILMDSDEWDKMLANATSEEYYTCDVVVNGTKFYSVGIRPKGNTSLSSIAMNPDSDRYSLKLEFDHFVEGQTCFGLDKLILNNNYADATNMKEAIIYDMFQYLGADASLYNYAELSLNGEYYGVYLALEAVEDSFMLRNYGTQDGELYKPDSMEMGGQKSSGSSGKSSDGDSEGGNSNGFSFDPGSMFGGDGQWSGSDFNPGNMPGNGSEGGSSDGSGFNPGNMPGGNGGNGGFSFEPGNMPGGDSFNPGNVTGKDSENSESGSNENSESGSERRSRPDGDGGNKGFSMGGNGGSNLNYSDDDLDSYSTIWNSAITGTSKADRRRVVTALKNISEGTDLETYLDIDNVLKYMAVHTFSVNMDSLSGSMAHNYYLYEYEGKLNILPWDYNLSLGGMSMGASGNASEMINDAIDTPFSGTHFFDALLENEEYLAKYHEYLQQLVDEYVNGGRFDEVYNRIRNQIDKLVETDPTAFYNYSEYQTAAEMLYQTIKLRAESIDGQLNGTIPSTDDGQRKDSSTLIDASSIDVTVMGQFNMGGNFGSFKIRSNKNKRGSSSSQDTSDTADTTGSDTGNATGDKENNTGNVPGNTGSDSGNSSDAGGSRRGGSSGMSGFDRDNMPDRDSFGSGNMPDMSSFSSENMPDMSNFSLENMPDMSNFSSENMPNMGGFGSGSFPGRTGSSGKLSNVLIFVICFVIMLAAVIILKFTGRMRYKRVTVKGVH